MPKEALWLQEAKYCAAQLVKMGRQLLVGVAMGVCMYGEWSMSLVLVAYLTSTRAAKVSCPHTAANHAGPPCALK